METCKICKEEFKNLKSLTTHINSKHNLKSKEYYDTYIKNDRDGKCVVCDKQTTYRNIGVGYLKNCSIECRNNNNDIKRDYWKGKNQKKTHIEKRISNTNQKNKEEVRKNTMINKYGVDNPAKLEYVKNKLSEKFSGRKLIRTISWQKNIINSKKKNGTTKHSKETRKKISEKLNKYFSENLDREKYINGSNNVNHLSGWYKNLYFRSSLELSFLVNNKNKNYSSCENNKYRIIYNDNDGKKRVYYPDFTDGEYIFEIKPLVLVNLFNNNKKILEAKKIYGDKYNVITEIESPYIEKNIIYNLIKIGEVVLTERSKKILEKYKT